MKQAAYEAGAQLKPGTFGGGVVGISEKSRLITTLLAWFLGPFGAHRFYLGKIGTAIAMLLTLGGFGIWYLIDLIMAAAGAMKDKEGNAIKNWQ